MNKKRELIPALRFPEFVNEGEWREIELEKIAKKVVDKNKDGLIKNVFTNSAIDGIVDQRDYFDKDIADKNNLENYYIVEDGDYVYNPRISTIAPVGPISKNKTNKRGAISPLYTVFRFTDRSNDFYEYYFKTTHWYNAIRKASNTGARFDRMSITDSVFMNISVLYPSPKEQQKIANCLSSLNEVIAAYNKKLDLLKEHRKGLMQNLFPQEGEKVPKYRFKEFENDGEWTEKELKEVAIFVNKKSSLKNLSINTYISTENLLPDYAGINIASKLPTSGNFTKYEKNDILISNIRPYLRKIWYSNQEGACSNDVFVARANPGINSLFLSFILKNDDFINYVMIGARGVKMPRGDKDSISKYPISYPTKKTEQQKIADCLSSLYELIAAQAEKIDQLKLCKKGLMQGLFPKTKD
jgi:type I restriction enzyme S subunit